MENDNVYTKYCLVPQCLSSTKVSPGKIFLSLAVGSSDKNKEKRKLWLQAINRNDLSEKTRGFVCEDHFEAVLLNISDGPILGGTDRTVDNNEMYYYFRGIPYAEPPIGHLRFEPPLAKTPWEDTIDCTTEGSQCIQGSDPVNGSEDCLFINVYTPSLNGSLAVLVYMAGGAFAVGDSTYAGHGPDYFLEQGIVFVSFNYRLGIFGFIGTEDLTCPGNAGLKDQVLALNWVQRNIAFFGGNPENVTIFGDSAGAASVAYHLQSNVSRESRPIDEMGCPTDSGGGMQTTKIGGLVRNMAETFESSTVLEEIANPFAKSSAIQRTPTRQRTSSLSDLGRNRDSNATSTKKTKRPKHEAILISGKDMTYADLLRTVKRSVNPSELGAEVKNIKKTKNGNILLTVSNGYEKAEALKRKIEEKVPVATTSHLVNKTVIHIKDLDEVSTEEEIKDAITEAIALMLQNALAGLSFGPVREPVHDGAFFTGESEDMLSRGQFNRVPCLMGVNSNEAAVIREVTATFRLYVGSYALKTNDLAPVDLTDNPIRRYLAANAIKCRYFRCSITVTSSENIVKLA
ncbi:unnamed protein product [Phaedon cochleariae]|uniref:Carboxylic ester hydrolase n=1 Tax=Phaedon cochleariae TaxID=80249 RepID=A0A9N9SHX5_PHACE|nr:unnamed protein product [Phaedon cochleariae]